MTLEELLAEIDAKWDGTTKPGAFYSEAGQCTFWYVESVPYYAKCINKQVTIYKALDDDRIIGGMVSTDGDVG